MGLRPSPTQTEVDLSARGLASFPTDVLELKNLKALNLQGNNIKALPSEVGRLTNLEVRVS